MKYSVFLLQNAQRIFLIFYLVMLSTAFYLGFVDVSNINDISKAASSTLYNAVWATLYLVLLLFIFLDFPKLPKGLIPAALLIGITLLNYGLYGVQPSSVMKFVTFAMTLLFASWAATRFSTEEFFDTLLKIAAVIGLVHLAIYPLYSQLSEHYDRLQRLNLFGLPSYAGLFAHKNHAATFFAIAFLIGVSRIISKVRPTGTWLWLSLLLFIICIGMTGAVGPLLAALVGIGVIIIVTSFHRNVGLGLGILAVLLTTSILLAAFPEAWLGLFNRETTLTGREYLYQSWFSYFYERVLTGYGFGEAFNGTTRSIGEDVNGYYGRSWANFQNFESGYLQAAIDFGLAGLLIYAYMFFRAWRYAFFAAKYFLLANRLLPLALIAYLTIASVNEVLIVVGNTLPLAILFFLSCKAAIHIKPWWIKRAGGSRAANPPKPVTDRR